MSEKKPSLKKIKNYTILHQLGLKGRDGRTFLVVDKYGYEYALKKFRSNKSESALKNEVDLQRKCSSWGIAPKIIDVDLEAKFFVMEKMDMHLIDEINAKLGFLSLKRQKELIKLWKTMDKLHIFHGDVNLLNYMIRQDKLYIIDFGMSKSITPKLAASLGTSTPNLKILLLSFVIKMKEANVQKASFTHLRTFFTPKEQQQHGI